VSIYSDLKAAWHTSVLRDIEDMSVDGLLPVPVHMYLILSDLCNQDCHFCHHRMSGGLAVEQFEENGSRNPNRRIPTDKAKEILIDFGRMGGRAVQFTGGGEPLVHPDFYKIAEFALDADLECALVTNASKALDYDVLKRFEWVRVSLDAGNASDYAKIRKAKPEMFDAVLRRVQDLAEHCPETTVGVSFVVTNDNKDGIVEAARYAEAAGAAYIRYSAVFSDAGPGYYDDAEDIRNRIRSAVGLVPGIKQINLFDSFMADLDSGAPDYKQCGFQHFAVYVGGNLKVYRCCTTSYTAQGEVGDLTNRSFNDWFFDDETLKRYQSFDARTCNVCHFNAKNRVINYLTIGEPDHVNFV